MKPTLKSFTAPWALKFEAVVYSPGSVPLIQSLDLEVPLGGCTVFMGPSGAGKSTLLRLGAGLIPPVSGKVRFRDLDWNQVSDHDNPQARMGLGFAFQNGALWANKSVYQNIELPYLYHKPKAERQQVREAVARAARLAGITSQLALRPSQLSLGEQKLVSLARALVMEPEVLFLDDPTGSLDAQATERLLGLFQDLKRQGTTLVLVTQEPTVTAQVADRLVVMKAGGVLTQGPFVEVVRSTDPEVMAILTSVLSQAATFSTDILDLLSVDQPGGDTLK
jgi:phospholipid/cholesterol/gamma-HCH transport system ATP-binding protein